jgi:hypothetical protein
VTGGDGKSKVLLDVATERNPGVGKIQHAKVGITASLDKDDFPFKLSDLLGLKNPAGFAAEKAWDLLVSAASRLGLPTQSVSIDVAYHDSEAYSIKGTRSIFAFYYRMPIELDLYTCEGTDGEWHGTVKLHGDLDYFGDPANQVFGRRFPNTVDQSYTLDFPMALGNGTVTRIDLVASLGGIVEMYDGWRALDRRTGAVVGEMTLTGDGQPLNVLAFLDGFDVSYPVTVGAPSHCPDGGLYFP